MNCEELKQQFFSSSSSIPPGVTQDGTVSPVWTCEDSGAGPGQTGDIILPMLTWQVLRIHQILKERMLGFVLHKPDMDKRMENGWSGWMDQWRAGLEYCNILLLLDSELEATTLKLETGGLWWIHRGSLWEHHHWVNGWHGKTLPGDWCEWYWVHSPFKKLNS